MLKVLGKFIDAEDGAVTVEWAVVTAAVVGLGLAIVSGVRSGVLDLRAINNRCIDDLDILKTFVGVRIRGLKRPAFVGQTVISAHHFGLIQVNHRPSLFWPHFTAIDDRTHLTP